MWALLGQLLVGCTDDAPARDESGQVIEAGALRVFDLQVGDCFNGHESDGGDEDAAADDEADDAGDDDVNTVTVVPCSELHEFEVYHLFQLADGEYPGPDAIEVSWTQGCLAEFENFIGISFDQSLLQISAIYPNEDTWDRAGDREVVCSVTALDGSPRQGSAQSSRL
jgi:hypothetical protein